MTQEKTMLSVLTLRWMRIAVLLLGFDKLLDGELWAGRGRFDAVQSTVAQGPDDEAGWRSVRYMVFDVPAQAGTFTQRQQTLQTIVMAINQPWVQAATQ